MSDLPSIVHEPILPRYASQFVLTGNDEHLVVDCASAVMGSAATGQTSLPVHTRLVLSWTGADRLAAMLAQALKQHASGSVQLSRTPSQPTTPESPLAAQLPRLEA